MCVYMYTYFIYIYTHINTHTHTYIYILHRRTYIKRERTQVKFKKGGNRIFTKNTSHSIRIE